MLWIAIALFLCAAILLIGLPFYRSHGRQTRQQMQALKQNLQSIDMDEKSEELSPEEADKQRKDTARRIVALEDENHGISNLSKVDRTIFISLAAMVILGSFALYTLLGSPQLATTAPINQAQDTMPNEFDEAIVRLVDHLEENPEDPEAWRLLAWSFTQANRFEEANLAYKKAMALTPNNVEALSGYGELLMLQADGQVTPQALEYFASALKIDPNDARSNYYSAVFLKQRGDLEGALKIWIAMLKSAPEGASWTADLLLEAQGLAKQLGTALPADLQASRGPNLQQVAAAKDMTPDQQEAMIASMIARLEQRLAQNPDDLAGWQQLIRSQQVQGQMDKAKAAYEQAIAIFAENEEAMATLQQFSSLIGMTDEKGDDE